MESYDGAGLDGTIMEMDAARPLALREATDTEEESDEKWTRVRQVRAARARRTRRLGTAIQAAIFNVGWAENKMEAKSR